MPLNDYQKFVLQNGYYDIDSGLDDGGYANRPGNYEQDMSQRYQDIKSAKKVMSQDNAANQERMRQWAAPVKQQNKRLKNNYMVDSSVSMTGEQGEFPGERYPSMSRKEHLQDGRGYNDYVQRDINRNSKVGNINRLAGPIGALPMVAPEAVGMIGAAQEAQRQGVNPMVNWLQRMTPVPVVAPTGNGGEVYNYQTGQRYTPEY